MADNQAAPYEETLERPGKYVVAITTNENQQFISFWVNKLEMATLFGNSLAATFVVYGMPGDVIKVEGAEEVAVRRIEYADTDR